MIGPFSKSLEIRQKSRRFFAGPVSHGEAERHIGATETFGAELRPLRELENHHGTVLGPEQRRRSSEDICLKPLNIDFHQIH